MRRLRRSIHSGSLFFLVVFCRRRGLLLFRRARRLFFVRGDGIQAQTPKEPPFGIRGLRIDRRGWDRHQRRGNVAFSEVSWSLLSIGQVRRRRDHLLVEFHIATPSAVCFSHASLKPQS